MYKKELMGIGIGFTWCVDDIDAHHSIDDFSIIKNLVWRDNMTEKEFEQRIDAATDRFDWHRMLNFL